MLHSVESFNLTPAERRMADDEAFLRNVVMMLDAGLTRVARNMIMWRLWERHAAEVDTPAGRELRR